MKIKSIILFALLVLAGNKIGAQGVAINPNGTAPDPSAGLDLGYDDKGFLLPRLTSAQRNAIVAPAVGLQIYNTTVNCLQVYMPLNGWRDVACDCVTPPSAAFTVPSAMVNAPVQFTAPAAVGSTYQWTFQSGSPSTSVQANPTTTWSAVGTYTVTLTVTDANGCYGQSSQQVTVITCPSPVLFNFTNCGVTGRVGPTQAQCNTSYTGTSLATGVTLNLGIQEWTIPYTGPYQIIAEGAAAGTRAQSGLGARVQAEFNLTAGGTLRVLVGQMGSNDTGAYSDGGGGGSFVSDGANLLVVAGGGGGAGSVNTVNGTDQNAVLVQNPIQTSHSYFGSSGAGYTGNGVHFAYGTYTTVAQSFQNGGAGQAGGQAAGWPGAPRGDGGFGGGGSACACSTGHGGGGGGYIGGGGGQAPSTTGTTYYAGFGGSSFTAVGAANVSTNVLATKTDGKVTITFLCQ